MVGKLIAVLAINMACHSMPVVSSSSSGYSYASITRLAFVPSSSRSCNRYKSEYNNNKINYLLSSSYLRLSQPDKGDLYSDDELFELLNLHETLNPPEKGLFSGEGDDNNSNGEINEESLIFGGIHDWVLDTLNDDVKSTTNNDIGIVQSSGSPTEVSAIPGLHDLVLETIEEIDSSAASEQQASNLQTLLSKRKPLITAIATDIDGTLLAGQYLHPTTEEAVVKAISHADKMSDKFFFPATGKSRRGAIDSLGPKLGPLVDQCPGVYIQGLYCVDADGNVVYEQKLSTSAIKAAEQLVKTNDISIVGYDGDDLYSTELTDIVVHLSEFYGEPTVKLIEKENDKILLAAHEPGLHKLLLMDDDIEKLAKIRLELEKLADLHDATVTQALPTMLELLPSGCSKANGVQKMCDHLGIDPASQLLALGDAENDVSMLDLASIGVAVGNACPQAKGVADFIMDERHDEGGAGVAIDLFGF